MTEEKELMLARGNLVKTLNLVQNKAAHIVLSVGHFLRTVHTCYPFLFSAPAFALV